MSVVARPNPEPVPDFRYAIEISGIVTGWFTECGGLTVERTLYPYQEGGLNAYVHQLPNRVTRTQVSLKRGVADEALWKWFSGNAGEGLYEGKVTYHDMTIILYNVDRTEARRWNLSHAYPVKWTGPSLKAGDNQVAVEALEIAQGGSDTPAEIQRFGADSDVGLSSSEQQGALDQAIDLGALADKVYKLLKHESRVERERLGWHRK